MRSRAPQISLLSFLKGAILGCLIATFAQAQTPRDASFADIFLNGRLIQDFTLILYEADRVYIEAYIYEALRLIPDSDDEIELDGTVYRALPELETLDVTFDPEDLILDIQAAPELFPTTNLTFLDAPPEAAPLEPISGILVNYGLYPRSRLKFENETRFDRFSLNGDFQLTGALKNVPGAFEAEAGLFWDDSGEFGAAFGGGRWRHDLLEQRKSLVVGETTARGLSLASSERFLGAQIGTNFRLEPGFSITPTVALDLLIDQPSEVRIVVNGQSRRIWETQEGPLRLTDLSFGNGQDVRILVSNESGETEVFQTTYYTAAQLLRPGLSEVALNGGVPKTGAFSYAWHRPFVSYALRRGLTNRITTSGAIRIDPHHQSLGGGVDASLGPAGTASLTSFLENGPSGNVQRINGGWFFSHNRNNFGASASWFSAKSDGFEPERGWNMNLSWNRPLAKRSNLSVSAYARRQAASGPLTTGLFGTIGTRIAGLSLGLNGGYRQANEDDYFFGFSLSRRLGRYRSGFSRTRVEQGRIQSIHAVQQRARSQNGVDVSMSSTVDDQNGFQNVTGSALWRHPKATISSSVAVSNGSASLNGQISGSFGHVDGLSFYARRISGAVAVADLIDGSETEVFLNNRSVGDSNQNGRVVLPGLIPFQRNRLSVNQDKIAFEYELEQANLQIVPKSAIGGRVTLPIRLNRTATLTLSSADGGYPAAGTVVRANKSEASGVVGHNGFVYLTGLLEGLNELSVRLPNGSCAFQIFIDRRVSDFGAVSCE